MRLRPTPTAVMMLTLASLVPRARADELGRWTSEHVARLRAVTAAVVSPDGSKIAYMLSVPRRPMVDDDGPAWAELHVVTPDKVTRPYVTGEVNVSEVAWTPDGNAMAFLAKRGKDEFKSLYLIPAEGGEARRALAFPADIAGFSFAPDGKRLAFLAVDPEPKAKADLKKKGFSQVVFEEDQRPVKVWIATLGDDASEPKALDLPGSASELHWNPGGDRLALALAPTPSVDDGFTRRKIHIVDSADGRILAKLNNRGKLGKIAWYGVNLGLLYIGAINDHDPAPGRLMFAGENWGKRDWDEPSDNRPDYPGHFTDFFMSDLTTINGLADVGVETRVNGLLAIGPGQKAQDMETGNLILTSASSSANVKTVAFVGQSPSHPGEVILGWKDGGVRLTDSNPWLAKMAFAKQEVVKYKARDG